MQYGKCYEGPFTAIHKIEFFTNSLQHKNASITNFVLAVSFKINKTNKVYNLKM